MSASKHQGLFGHYVHVAGPGKSTVKRAALGHRNIDKWHKVAPWDDEEKTGVRGFSYIAQLERIESGEDLVHIKEYLDKCEEHGTKLLLTVWDLWFGAKNLEQNYLPPSMIKYLAFGGNEWNTCTQATLWRPEAMDGYIAILKSLYDEVKDCEGFAGFEGFETTRAYAVGDTYHNVADAMAAQYQRLIVEMRSYMRDEHVFAPHYNFSKGSKDNLPNIIETQRKAEKGLTIGTPDIIYYWDPANPKHGEKTVEFYDTIRAEPNALKILNIQTRDMPKKPSSSWNMMFDHPQGSEFNLNPQIVVWFPSHPKNSSYESDVFKLLVDKKYHVYRGDSDTAVPKVPVSHVMPDKFSLRPKDLIVPSALKAVKNDFGFPMWSVLGSELVQKTNPQGVSFAHAYSTRQPWSSDEKYFLTYEGTAGFSYLLDGSSGAFVKRIDHGLYEAMWRQGAGHYLVGIDNATHQPAVYDVNLGTKTYKQISLDGFSAGGTEGNITPSSKVLYTEVDGDDVECVIVDYENGMVCTNLTLKGGGIGFDTATLSYSGKYVVLMAFKPRRTVIYDVKSSTTVEPRTLIADKSHGLMTVDANGRDTFEQVGLIEDNARRCISWDLETLEATVTLGGPGRFTNNYAAREYSAAGQSLTGHIGHGVDKAGNVLLSLEDPEGPHTCGFLKTDGSQDYLPVCYNYDRAGNYKGEPHGVASPSGKRVAIAAFHGGVRATIFVDTSSIDFGVDEESWPVIDEPEIEVDKPVVVDEPDLPTDIPGTAAEQEKQSIIEQVIAAIRALLNKLL